MCRLFFVLSIILACLSTTCIEAKPSQAQVAVQETELTKNRRLAEQGDAEAQFHLGMSYEFGVDVPKDYAKEKEWYEKAAAQGYVWAQERLGFMYEEGLGVRQDYVQAYRWLDLAATRGDEKLQDNRDDLEKKMTPEQIAEAQRLAREWKPTLHQGVR